MFKFLSGKSNEEDLTHLEAQSSQLDNEIKELEDKIKPYFPYDETDEEAVKEFDGIKKQQSVF